MFFSHFGSDIIRPRFTNGFILLKNLFNLFNNLIIYNNYNNINNLFNSNIVYLFLLEACH